MTEVEKNEARIQAEAYQWFHNTYPDLRGLLYHVPNGGTRNAIEATRLKAVGVVPGIPDVVFHYKARTWFFEFKDAKGRLSDEQVKIHDIMRKQGFIVWVVRTLEHFQQLIIQILEDREDPFKIGVTKEMYYYQHRVYEYLYNTLGHNELVLLSNLVETANMIKFVECVKNFMRYRFDEKANFELNFTPDYEAIYKRVNGEPFEPIFYKGKSIIE